mmetsp:Transcript_17136/g.21111  ORF Transcript_17136/g.21111 Transcript_17136/m.21111 type:complete len:163 (+) Transcript_17136:292-780(+)
MCEVTEKVREAEFVLSVDKEAKRYGQQKWKIFETNYQRTKGITLEESLEEIENFAALSTTCQKEVLKPSSANLLNSSDTNCAQNTIEQKENTSEHIDNIRIGASSVSEPTSTSESSNYCQSKLKQGDSKTTKKQFKQRGPQGADFFAQVPERSCPEIQASAK